MLRVINKWDLYHCFGISFLLRCNLDNHRYRSETGSLIMTSDDDVWLVSRQLSINIGSYKWMVLSSHINRLRSQLITDKIQYETTRSTTGSCQLANAPVMHAYVHTWTHPSVSKNDSHGTLMANYGSQGIGVNNSTSSSTSLSYVLI